MGAGKIEKVAGKRVHDEVNFGIAEREQARTKSKVADKRAHGEVVFGNAERKQARTKSKVAGKRVHDEVNFGIAERKQARTKSKVAGIVIALLVTVLSFLQVADWHSVGIYAHCPLSARLAYPFFHANLLHALLNAWCLLSIVFIYDVSVWRLLFAYAAAVTMPVDMLGAFLPLDSPTVGLSGVVYALFGTISFEVARKRYFQCWMLFYIAVGFLFPNTNAWLHLYGYLCGFIAALLNKPFDKQSANKQDRGKFTALLTFPLASFASFASLAPSLTI